MLSSRLPLSSLSANSVNGVGRKHLRAAGKNGHLSRLINPKRHTSRQVYVPLSPWVEHIGQSLLPFKRTDITELKVFKLFWDRVVVSVIMERTNAYAEKKEVGKATLEGLAFHHSWKSVIAEEVRVFFTLLIYIEASWEGGSNRFWGKEGGA